MQQTEKQPGKLALKKAVLGVVKKLFGKRKLLFFVQYRVKGDFDGNYGAAACFFKPCFNKTQAAVVFADGFNLFVRKENADKVFRFIMVGMIYDYQLHFASFKYTLCFLSLSSVVSILCPG